MTDNEQSIVLVVIVCFVVGYWAVSVLWKRKAATHSKPRQQPATEESSGDGVRSEERRCREILGVSYSADEREIRAAYRSQLAKYHPDKVTHLGDEFYDLASRRTKEIIEAYQFFKSRYGFR
jgi:DnaJ-domain-containing protein 1